MTPAKFASLQHAVQRRIYAGRSQDEAEARALKDIVELARIMARDVLPSALELSVRRPMIFRNR